MGDSGGAVVRREDVLEMPELGIRIEILRRARDTGGELVEFDVIGRPRGMLRLGHVHAAYAEHIEVVAGTLRLRMGRSVRLLRSGDRVVIPAGTRHAQLPQRRESHHLHVEWRPAGPTEAFGERLAAMSRAGELNRWGFPTPRAAAALARDFGTHVQPAWPPAAVQLAAARALLSMAAAMSQARHRARRAVGRAR
jgi:quercetin dioxygenase-like cupin family protein